MDAVRDLSGEGSLESMRCLFGLCPRNYSSSKTQRAGRAGRGRVGGSSAVGVVHAGRKNNSIVSSVQPGC